MNANIEDLDGYTGKAGNTLLDCEEYDLVLVNRVVKCLGKFTLQARRCQSSMDLCLMSHKLCRRLERMHRDEDGEY